MWRFKQILLIVLIIYPKIIITNGTFPPHFKWKLTLLYWNWDKPNPPCNNFYKYACGNYDRDNPDANYKEITQKLSYEMNDRLIQRVMYLMKYINYENQTYTDKLLIYWESCVNEKRKNITKYLQEIKPSDNFNWPLLEPDKEWLAHDNNFDYWSLLGQLHAHGLNNVIIKQEIIRNKNNTLDIWLAPAAIPTEGSLPENNTIEILLTALGLKDVEPVVQQLHYFDVMWRELVNSSAESNSVKETTLKNLTLFYPQLKLQQYLENLLETRELENISTITIKNPEFFENLNQKLWNDKKLSELCNYLMIKFLYYLAVDSTAEFTPLECMKDLRNKFDLAVSAFYYDYFFRLWKDKYLEPFNKILKYIKETMAEYFDENYLSLPVEDVRFLKTKLEAIKINIGNLPINFSNGTIEEFYQAVTKMDKENYYKNHLLLLKQRFRNSLLYTPNQTHYIVTSYGKGITYYPFYVAQQNMIIVPFDTFQLSIFNYNDEPLQHISLMGFVLARELTHAFDTTGLQYDEHGIPFDFPSDIIGNENFGESLKCMQRQHLTNDIDERIADFFAVRVAYRTYLKRYAKVNDNWQRSFFKNLAQGFCGNNDTTVIDHDTDEVRLTQIVNNFQPFQDAFQCPTSRIRRIKCRLY